MRLDDRAANSVRLLLALHVVTAASAPSDGRDKACDLFVGIDDEIYDRYNRSLPVLVEKFEFLVRAANEAFSKNVFAGGKRGSVYFRLKRLQVMFDTCDGLAPEQCSELDNPGGYFVKNFNDKTDLSDFCLGYIFTDVDLVGVSGMAYVGSACDGGSANSGVVTLRGSDVSSHVATFIHELGHSFGAKHDVDAEEEGQENCRGNYYMDGGGIRSKGFSPCSLDAMHKKLDGVEDCFVDSRFALGHTPDLSVCGNGILEVGEECDCGEASTDCDNACCYPAKITLEMRRANSSARPCSWNGGYAYDCGAPTALYYGVYAPFLLMFVMSLIGATVLTWDWKANRRLFEHVTKGNVKILRPGEPRPVQAI